MRLFFAIDPDPILRASISELQNRLRGLIDRQGVRFVPLEKVHLTLLYLGHVPDESVDDKIVRAGTAFEGLRSFSVNVSDLGAFPDRSRPRTIWTAAHDSEGDLGALHRKLFVALFGDPPLSSNEMVPHLTLARVSPPSKKVGTAIAPLRHEVIGVSLGNLVVDQITLVSTESDGGYRTVFRWNLLPRSLENEETS